MLSEQDRAYLRELVRVQAANNLLPSNSGDLQDRLWAVAQREGAASVTELMANLRSGRSAILHRVVAEAMTIKETSFFRDVAPFDALRTRLLPEFIERRKASRRLRIWSAACSTGQEAYSVAMLLREHFPLLAAWDVQIVGTDISQTACDYARRGRYRPMEMQRGLPITYRSRYFEQQGDEWVVCAPLRKLVRFERADLCSPHAARGMFDLVLLRNVLLYLSREDRVAVLRHVHAHMQPGAPLLLGSAEQAEDSCDLFRVQFEKDCYFYRPVVAA